jgi:hypothetical protein
VFVVRKRIRKVIHNFDLTDIYQDEFFVAVVRPAEAVVEIRGSYGRARLLTNTWLQEFAAQLD